MFIDGEFQPGGRPDRPGRYDGPLRAGAALALFIILAITLSLMTGRPAVDPGQLLPHAAKRHPAPLLNPKAQRCLRQLHGCR